MKEFMKMNKKLSRFLAVAMVLMLVLAMVPTASAEVTTHNTTGKVTFDKNFIVSGSLDTVPDETFSFTLAAAAPLGIGTDKLSVFNGILEGVSVTGGTGYTSATGQFSVSFSSTTPNHTGAVGDPVETDAGKKYATKTFDIDFNSVNWTNGPGVYRYALSEDQGSTDGITYSDVTYYIDVYVEYKSLGGEPETWEDTLSIADIIVTKTTQGEVTETTVANKVDASATGGEGDFNNELASFDLTIKKTVAGNQGNRNDYFKFVVTLSDVEPDGTFTITAPTNAAPNTSDESITATEGNGTATIWLKNGETATIGGLPHGAKWSVKEELQTAQTGYTITASATVPDSVGSGTQAEGGSFASPTYTGNESGLTADVTVTFTNTRSGTIPTGVLLTVAPFAALMAVGLVGAAAILKKKRAEEE